MPIIRLQNVYKTYTKTQEIILNNIDLSIYENEFITIGGQSGSGKSTLLRILGLIDTHFDGSYYTKDALISQTNENQIDGFRKSWCSIIFQDYNLISRYSIYRNLELALIVDRCPYKFRKSKIHEVMSQVNLCHSLLSRKPEALSGGQKQRVSIARALLCDSKILIADEPTGSLDDTNAFEIIELFKSLNLTLIVATHDKRIANLSDRHIHVDKGNIHVT